jgi:homocysteine S-methyltransferase
VIDGGLATELERRGADLSGRLWSARLLRDDPDAIRRVHADYLEAGARVIISASYQASVEGFAGVGLDRDVAERLLRRSVELAREAAEEHGAAGVRVAASVGPFGATLADGSEYRGDDGRTVEELVAFHRPRIETLLVAGPDLLAVETIPSIREVEAVARILTELPEVPAWVSCTGRDEERIADGTSIRDAADVVAAVPSLVGFGVNCTPPGLVDGLLREARRAVPGLPLVAYPNASARWDATARSWVGRADPSIVAATARRWVDDGAAYVGGCCGTGPEEIRAISRARAT